MIKKLLFFCLLFITMNVHAKECTKQEVDDYTRKANMIVSRHELKEEGENKYLELTFFNTDSEMMLMNKDNIEERYYFSDESLSIDIEDISKITTRRYDVYLNDRQCKMEPLRTIEVKLPRYNEKSESEFCQENINNKCCVKITYDENELICDSISEKPSSGELQSSKINAKSETNNLIYIIIAVVIVIGIITGLIIKKYIDNKKIRERGII